MDFSAIDRGHGAGPGRTVNGKRNVAITDAQAIGRYATRPVFDDGHDTGLYSWDELLTASAESKPVCGRTMNAG